MPCQWRSHLERKRPSATLPAFIECCCHTLQCSRFSHYLNSILWGSTASKHVFFANWCFGWIFAVYVFFQRYFGDKRVSTETLRWSGQHSHQQWGKQEEMPGGQKDLILVFDQGEVLYFHGDQICERHLTWKEVCPLSLETMQIFCHLAATGRSLRRSRTTCFGSTRSWAS